MLSDTMKSSRFMGSEVEMLCSDEFRSCWAMPLGAFRAEPLSLWMTATS